MKTIVIAALMMSSVAGSLSAQERPQRPQRGPERGVEQFRRLPQERQQQMRERLQRFREMSAEDKAQMRERLQRFKQRVAEKAPERVERLRALRGQLHRPERGRFEQNPQSLQDGRQHAQRLANQKREQLIERLLGAGKIDRAQADRMSQMPLPEFFAMVRRFAGKGPETRPGVEGRPAPERPGVGRPEGRPKRGGEPHRNPQRGERPQKRQGANDRRGGV